MAIITNEKGYTTTASTGYVSVLQLRHHLGLWRERSQIAIDMGAYLTALAIHQEIRIGKTIVYHPTGSVYKALVYPKYLVEYSLFTDDAQCPYALWGDGVKTRYKKKYFTDTPHLMEDTLFLLRKMSKANSRALLAHVKTNDKKSRKIKHDKKLELFHP